MGTEKEQKKTMKRSNSKKKREAIMVTVLVDHPSHYVEVVGWSPGERSVEIQY